MELLRTWLQIGFEWKVESQSRSQREGMCFYDDDDILIFCGYGKMWVSVVNVINNFILVNTVPNLLFFFAEFPIY